MSKRLNAKAIAEARRSSSRSERRERLERQLHEDINLNQCNGGVLIIPPPEQITPQAAQRKKRAAGYVRVSTQEEQQVGSFEMQVLHLKEAINNNPAWEMVEIFQDKGISGTSVHKRVGFQRMMATAEAGEIDVIITKSISRFGRNIVDVLNNLRKLSALAPPVTVIFEQENLTSNGDGSNNLLLAILSALAEMESQQKSEAIKMGIRWRMERGVYKFAVHNTLGYYRDNFGRVVIEPMEAKIVEFIYDSYLEGASISEIAEALTEQGIASPLGKPVWGYSAIRGILSNEKYCGDALMQKTYTKDFREHKSVKNTTLNKYFKQNHHKAIIPRHKWQKVQEILSHRREVGGRQLRRNAPHVIVRKVKGGVMQGAYMLDLQWTAENRREFLKQLDNENNKIDER